MTADVRAVVAAEFRFRKIAELVAEERVTRALRRDRIKEIAGINALRFDVGDKLVLAELEPVAHDDGKGVRPQLLALVFLEGYEIFFELLKAFDQMIDVAAALL